MKYPPLVLKRGVAPMSSELVAWCRDVLAGGIERSVVPKLLQVSLLNGNGQPLRAWSFADAYSVKWEIEPFNATRNEVAIEMIALSCLHTRREL